MTQSRMTIVGGSLLVVSRIVAAQSQSDRRLPPAALTGMADSVKMDARV